MPVLVLFMTEDKGVNWQFIKHTFWLRMLLPIAGELRGVHVSYKASAPDSLMLLGEYGGICMGNRR